MEQEEFTEGCTKGDLETVKKLISKMDKRTQDRGLANAINENKMELMRYLLENKVDSNGRNVVGDPIIHNATKSKNKAAIELLVSFGADINAIGTSYHFNSLHLACLDGDLEIVKLLISLGADWRAKEFNGRTPLQLAKLGDYDNVVEFLNEIELVPASYVSHVVRLKELERQLEMEKNQRKELERKIMFELKMNDRLNSEKIALENTTNYLRVQLEKKKNQENNNDGELASFLNSLSLSSFFNRFHSESIDLEILKQMNEHDFEKLGLNMGQRKKLLFAISTNLSKKNVEMMKKNDHIDFIGFFGLNRKEIVEGIRIGEGGNGIVSKSFWNGLVVATKQLKITKMSEKNAQQFKDEANLMFRLRHPRIVQLMGFVSEEPYMLIMEFVEKGNLSDFLTKGNSENLDWVLKKQLALQIAQGMMYLHGKDVLHRDLKSLNVLLTQNLEVKLSDFGLAAIKQELLLQSGEVPAGTFAWMAPELLNGEANTKESDVYSFGIVCFEIASRKLPWKGIPPALIISNVSNGKREEIPKDCPREFNELIASCWAQSILIRPNFGNIVNLLQSSLISNNTNSYHSNISLENLEE